jgi:predicted transcriptional regulator
MQSSDIKTLRKEVKEYINHSDERMVRAIHAMLTADSEKDWWDETTEAQKASIERGLKDMEDGNTIPHEEMVKQYSKWLTK